MRLCGAIALFPLLVGCGSGQPAGAGPSPSVAAPPLHSDQEKVRTADVSILFVGNSHTSMYDLPNLICEMIRFRHPEKTTYSHVLSVGFLEQVANDARCREEVETRSWKYVVLQAQKISVSGKYNYSRTEGIDYAKLAKSRGATVLFFAEWGLKGKPGDGPRQEKVYQEMAAEAGVGLAGVARAWDLALAERPELPLHSVDGNHQSAVGAFLTAAFLYARLTGENPAPLAEFPYKAVNDADRKFLAEVAARAAGG